MNGGRKKWLEEDRPITKDLPTYPKRNFKSSDPDTNIRVFLNYVRNTLGSKVLVDVRSPKEFTGEILAPPEYPTEHAQRGGHIPGAANIPWAQAVNEDGTFKTPEECKSYTTLRAYLLLTKLYAIAELGKGHLTAGLF